MKFKIEITYEEIGSKLDYSLDVRSEFSDDAAGIVGATLEAFTKEFAETKNNTRYVNGGAKKAEK